MPKSYKKESDGEWFLRYWRMIYKVPLMYR
jgi:hypothetical protein